VHSRLRLAHHAKAIISTQTLRHIASPNTDHAFSILSRSHGSFEVLNILGADLVVDSAHFIRLALHLLVVGFLIFRKFGLVDACFGVKTILEQVTLLIELLVNVGSLQEVALNEGLLVKNNLLWIDGGPLSHQLPPCLPIRCSHSPSISLRYYGLLYGPVDRLSSLIFLILSL